MTNNILYAAFAPLYVCNELPIRIQILCMCASENENVSTLTYFHLSFSIPVQIPLALLFTFIIVSLHLIVLFRRLNCMYSNTIRAFHAYPIHSYMHRAGSFIFFSPSRARLQYETSTISSDNKPIFNGKLSTPSLSLVTLPFSFWHVSRETAMAATRMRYAYHACILYCMCLVYVSDSCFIFGVFVCFCRHVALVCEKSECLAHVFTAGMRVCVCAHIFRPCVCAICVLYVCNPFMVVVVIN